MTFGERLTELRKEHGFFKRNDFAEVLGIPSTTLRNYETDVREPGHTFLKQVSELFNVSVDYLLCLTDDKEVLNTFRLTASEQEHIEKYRSLDATGRQHVDTVLDWEGARIHDVSAAQIQNTINRIYPYLRKIACAGTGFYFDDIPSDTIEAPYIEGADFIIGVSGDSMEPDYHDGDKLYVKKTEHLAIGDTGIFTIGNECYLKELGPDGLISRNPAYKNIPGTEDIRLIGKVIGRIEN